MAKKKARAKMKTEERLDIRLRVDGELPRGDSRGWHGQAHCSIAAFIRTAVVKDTQATKEGDHRMTWHSDPLITKACDLYLAAHTRAGTPELDVRHPIAHDSTIDGDVVTLRHGETTIARFRIRTRSIRATPPARRERAPESQAAACRFDGRRFGELVTTQPCGSPRSLQRPRFTTRSAAGSPVRAPTSVGPHQQGTDDDCLDRTVAD